MKEPEYVMKIMSTYGGLLENDNQNTRQKPKDWHKEWWRGEKGGGGWKLFVVSSINDY